jgi:hypothetical protein
MKKNDYLFYLSIFKRKEIERMGYTKHKQLKTLTVDELKRIIKKVR